MTKPADAPRPFTWPVRVYYEDTDAGGIVYHPNYLNFAIRARSEMLRAKDCGEPEFYKKHGILLVVRHVEVDYRASATLDDLLEVSVEVERIGNSSLTLVQHITRGGERLATVKVVLVAINDAKRAVRLPPQLRQIFAG